MKKLRHRKIKWLAQGPTADRWESWDLNPGRVEGRRSKHLPPCPFVLGHSSSGLHAAMWQRVSSRKWSCRLKKCTSMLLLLEGQKLAREWTACPRLRERDPYPPPHPRFLPVRQLQLVGTQEAGAHTGLFVFGGNPAAPTTPLKGPLSPNQQGLPGARPGWETWHIGDCLATLPSGHAESTQESFPLKRQTDEAEGHVQGVQQPGKAWSPGPPVLALCIPLHGPGPAPGSPSLPALWAPLLPLPLRKGRLPSL